MKKVFLGGTCNESLWRSELIKMLQIDYFNPVVPDWTEECCREELRQRDICDYCLYVITPKMTGVYSVAEAIDDSNKPPSKTLFCVLREDDGMAFSQGQMKSLEKVAEMVDRNGGYTFDSLSKVADFLNLYSE